MRQYQLRTTFKIDPQTRNS